MGFWITGLVFGGEMLMRDIFWIDKYFELLKERKVKGYLFQEKNYFEKEQ